MEKEATPKASTTNASRGANGKVGVMEMAKRIFHHPNFNAICGVVTILSLVFAVWCWKVSIRERELTAYISPTRTPIVQQGKLENFAATFMGNPIRGDLSACEIQIWNAGKEPIRRENILKPITISTANGEQIYQVTWKGTRDVIGFTNFCSTNGVITLDWKILEQNDGVKLQFIYNGNVATTMRFDGVVEGQKSLVFGIVTKASGWRELGLSVLIIGISVLWVIASIATVTKIAVRLTRGTKFKGKFLPLIASIVLLAMVICNLFIGVWLGMVTTKFLFGGVTPPFGW